MGLAEGCHCITSFQMGWLGRLAGNPPNANFRFLIMVGKSGSKFVPVPRHNPLWHFTPIMKMGLGQNPMTDHSPIRALITKIEAGHVGREESDEYLVLCCGWKFTERPWDATTQERIISPTAFEYYRTSDDSRPHPLANAQDALDSLPEGCGYNILKPDDIDAVNVSVWDRDCNAGAAEAKSLAAAICLANLRRLEGE